MPTAAPFGARPTLLYARLDRNDGPGAILARDSGVWNNDLVMLSFATGAPLGTWAKEVQGGAVSVHPYPCAKGAAPSLMSTHQSRAIGPSIASNNSSGINAPASTSVSGGRLAKDVSSDWTSTGMASGRSPVRRV
jgi:hypothetical protein